MTRISRTTHGNRVRENYVRKMTNVDHIRFVEKVDQIEKSAAPNNHSSENYLMSYDHYYETVEELKKSFKRFYYFGKDSTFSISTHKEQLSDQMIQLVEKYNEAIAALRHLDSLEGTDNIRTFHLIFTVFANDFFEIGIYEKEDYTLAFDSIKFLKWLELEQTEQTALHFIRQFKLTLMKEYQSVFNQLTRNESFLIKGLVVEEKG